MSAKSKARTWTQYTYRIDDCSQDIQCSLTDYPREAHLAFQLLVAVQAKTMHDWDDST